MERPAQGWSWWCCSLVESSMKGSSWAVVMSVLPVGWVSFGGLAWWVWNLGSVVGGGCGTLLGFEESHSSSPSAAECGAWWWVGGLFR